MSFLFRFNKLIDNYLDPSKGLPKYTKKKQGLIKGTYNKILKPLVFKPIGWTGKKVFKFTQKHPNAAINLGVYLGGGSVAAAGSVEGLHKLSTELPTSDRYKGMAAIGGSILAAHLLNKGLGIAGNIAGNVAGNVAGGLAEQASSYLLKPFVRQSLMERVLGRYAPEVTKNILSATTKGAVGAIGAGLLYAGHKGFSILDKRKAMQVFEEVIQSPDLRDVPREELLKYFNTILRFAPKVATDPVALHNYLKQAVVYGTVDLQTIRTLQDVNNKL